MNPYDENLLAAYAMAKLIVATVEALVPAAKLAALPCGVCEVGPDGGITVRFSSPLDLHATYEQRQREAQS